MIYWKSLILSSSQNVWCHLHPLKSCSSCAISMKHSPYVYVVRWGSKTTIMFIILNYAVLVSHCIISSTTGVSNHSLGHVHCMQSYVWIMCCHLPDSPCRGLLEVNVERNLQTTTCEKQLGKPLSLPWILERAFKNTRRTILLPLLAHPKDKPNNVFFWLKYLAQV